MVEMVVPAPLIIGSRLMACYVAEGFAKFHVEPIEFNGRWKYRIIVEEENGRLIHVDEDLESGVGNDVMLVDTLDNFLGFLGAAADAYAFEMMNGEGSSDNGKLFHPLMMEWCYQNAEDLSMAQFLLTQEPEDDEEPPRCVTCGVRPWGFGYCGEQCAVCAAKS